MCHQYNSVSPNQRMVVRAISFDIPGDGSTSPKYWWNGRPLTAVMHGLYSNETRGRKPNNLENIQLLYISMDYSTINTSARYFTCSLSL